MSREFGDLVSPEMRALMAEHEATEAVLRPKRVAAAKEWQPLRQLLIDSGVAGLISDKTGAELPEIEFVGKLYQHVPPASAWPREETVNTAASISESRTERVFPYGSGWSVRIAIWPQQDGEFDSTLRLEAMSADMGEHRTVHFELDQNKVLRIAGAEETFSGPIDHLNKRGLQRVNSGINRAFGRPEVGKVNMVALAGVA